MNALETRYDSSLALLTDLYQLTMASAYWKQNRRQQQSVFHLYFRSNPFAGGFTIAAGLADAIDYVEHLKFSDDDIAYLATLRGENEVALFEKEFLDELRKFKFTGDIDAIPEGTVVFPNEPIVRVRGPILECQILETTLLNLINFQSLVATKAARVCIAAAGDPVVEFGLRRAQGIDGALSASRAAFIGGCTATSNVQAGKLFGIPVRGTHAHSWVMSFDSEIEAFEAYADAMPHNCTLLVDTYDTLQGVHRAVSVAKRLEKRGHKLSGIRLDSGDLAYLSIEARKILDEAGLKDVTIMATNDLDEHLITSLKQQGAAIKVWGVGTKLVTAYDQPALGGIYKLGAVRDGDGPWEYKIKASEQTAKSSTPGVLQVRRFSRAGRPVVDAIFSETIGIDNTMIVDPNDVMRRRAIEPDATWQDLLVPVFRNGRCVYARPALEEIRATAFAQVNNLHPGVRRFVKPHEYPAGLEPRLSDLRAQLLVRARAQTVTT